MRIGGVDGFPLTLGLDHQQFDAFRLELTAPGRIQFNEFEAWSGHGANLENVARGQSVSQSSSPQKGHGAAGGNSGRVHASIGAITEFESDPWWQVDLDGHHRITHINLFNRIAHNASAMDQLRILGRNNGEWKCLYDHRDQAHVATFLRHRLVNECLRIESQLAHAVTPRLSRIGTADVEIGHEVLAAWDETSKLGHLADLMVSLSGLLSSSDQVAIPSLEVLRAAAKLAMPRTLDSRLPHSRLISTAGIDRLSLRTFDGVEDEPVQAVRICDAELDLSHPTAAAGLWADHWTPRMQHVAEWDTPGDVYFLDLDGRRCKHAKWEIWGRAAGGEQVLVYDSLGLSGAALALLQVCARLGLDDFETLDGILAGLELEGRTVSAVATSRWFEVGDPGLARFERSLQEVELRSSLDLWRKPVTRTKHGYKTTHRFMDPEAYAKGTKRLLDIVGEHAEFSHVFAGFGTLLGFIREDGFIPHDDDADLVIVTNAQNKSDMVELRETLRTHLSSQTDFRLYDGSKLPGLNLPVGFVEDGQSVHIDLFLTYYQDGQLMIFNDRTKAFEPIDPELLTLGRETTIHGVRFEIPTRSEDLLEVWYGPNWSTPMTSYLLGYSWQQS